MRSLAVALCSCGLGLLCTPVEASDLRIDNVTIVSPERASPMRHASVLIHDDRIVRISAHSAHPTKVGADSADVIDGTGLYLTPGLIDTHVHLVDMPGMRPDQEQANPEIVRAAREQFPKSYLHFGFTTLLDLNSTPQAMADWNAHAVRPDTYFCGGTPILDGYPLNFIPPSVRYQASPYFLVEPGSKSPLPAGIDPTMHTPEAVVKHMKSDGATCVKAFFERGFGPTHDLPVPQLETIQALVRAAHAVGMPVFLHANSSEAQAFGLQAGVDIFAHGLWNWDEPWSTREITPAVQKILDGVIASNRGWQPTIQVLYGEHDLFNDAFLSDPRLATALPASLIDWYRTKDGQWFHDLLATPLQAKPGEANNVDAGAIARDNNAVAYMAKHEARLLFGSDTPSGPTFANPPGLNGWFEMQRLAESGMTPAQIFRATTLANAEAIGMSHEIGTVQAGKRANLLLLHADPTQTLHAYEKIEKVILHGHVLDPAALAANH
ncbi:MAG: hypothetical protein JWM63_5279 [Gammaproteobacteria bacterium]|nr:hypothetical protein [Gammaproteobacteria bacterium]